MDIIRKSILVFFLAFAGMQSAQAQDATMIPQDHHDVMEPNQVMFINVGSARTQKFFVQRFDFQPPRFNDRVFAVRIIGTRAVTDVQAVHVVLRNGRIFSLPSLEGLYSTGESDREFTGGRRIREVRVFAKTANLIGSRSAFRVDMAVFR